MGGFVDGKNINNKKAVALRYEPGKDRVPVITAVGSGLTAQKIINTALENKVPVYEDSFQAEVLSSFEAGSHIPGLLYDLVAEILVFVEEIDERRTADKNG